MDHAGSGIRIGLRLGVVAAAWVAVDRVQVAAEAVEAAIVARWPG